MSKGSKEGFVVLLLSPLVYKDGERAQRERDGHEATLALAAQ